MMSEPDVVASGLGVEGGIPRAAPALELELELELGPVVAYNNGLLAYSYMGLAEHLDQRAFLLVDVQRLGEAVGYVVAPRGNQHY